MKITKESIPTLVVSRHDYESLAYAKITKYIIHGRKGLKIVPPVAQEIGENQVVFPDAPKQIRFRKRFSRQAVVRKVMHITADNSDRYDLQFILALKP